MTAEDTTDTTEEPTGTDDTGTDTAERDETSHDGDRLPADHPVVKALAKANKEAEQARLKVKEFEDRDKSDHDKLAEALEAAKADSTTSKAEAARLRAAIKHGLSEDDLDLLGSGTPEEIEKRAERLATRLADGGTYVPPSRNQGGGREAPQVDVTKVVDSIPRL